MTVAASVRYMTASVMSLTVERPTHRRQALHHVLRSVPVKRRVDDARRDGVHAYALFRVFHRQAPRDGLKAAFRDHRNCSVYSGDRVIHHRRRDIDDASAGLLNQHLLDRELADEEKTFDVDGNERPQIVDRVIREALREIYAGVVNERVDRSEFALGDFGDLRCRCSFGDASVDQRELV